MIITDEILNAYLDGELTVDEIAEVAKQIEASPDLSKRMENMRINDKSFAQSFHEIDTKPMPDNIMAILDGFPKQQQEKTNKNDSNVVSFKKKIPFQTNISLWQTAIAASIALFIGIGAGRGLIPSTSQTDITADQVLAQQTSGIIGEGNMLYDVLENQPSSTPLTLIANNNTFVIPTMTFRNEENGYCREYRVMAPNSSTQNVACRIEDKWIVKLSVGLEAEQANDEGLYQTASQVDDPLVTAIIAGMITGDPLSADNETIIMNNNWQK